MRSIGGPSSCRGSYRCCRGLVFCTQQTGPGRHASWSRSRGVAHDSVLSSHQLPFVLVCVCTRTIVPWEAFVGNEIEHRIGRSSKMVQIVVQTGCINLSCFVRMWGDSFLVERTRQRLRCRVEFLEKKGVRRSFNTKCL